MRRISPFVRGVVVCFLAVLFAGAGYAQEETPTSEGSLHLLNADLKEVGLCPLKRTDVRADVTGFISRVTVTQTFQNPRPEAIEAIYTFPLPNDAAVDDMSIVIGSRVIRGRILERQKAKETYEKAKQEGKTAALLEQQRPNVFTQFVANITPNAEIKVTISYVETLRYNDDSYEFTFPMTIGKRYMPATMTPEEKEKITVPTADRPGHTIAMEINIEAGVPVTGVSSVSHEIDTDSFSASRFTVRLKDGDTIPNRDFVLRYKTAGSRIEDAVIAHHDTRGGFFTLILQPPDKIMPADITPKEIVFVLDTSGSMSGFPNQRSREIIDLSLAHLNPNDTFNLITFAGDTRILFNEPVPATPENVDLARKMLEGADAGGGTEMMTAIKAALEPSDSQDHIRVVCFMTDGEVGNDRNIIEEIQNHPNARIFAFGIGTSINRYLLDEMSREGRGEVEYVTRNDDGSAAARRFFERVRNPLMTDISLEYRGGMVSETYPQEVPDLFDAKPVTITGRYAQGGPATIVLRGRLQGQVFSREINVDFPVQNTQNELMATLWARKKIAELARRDVAEKKGSITKAITRLGLEYRLLTSFTSLVAVDETVVTSGGQPVKIKVPEAEGYNSTQAAVVVPPNPQYPNYGIGATVNVTAGAETSTSSSVTTSSTSTQINLQLNGRSFQSITSTAPGVALADGKRSPNQSGLVLVNGQASTSNQFMVDGVDVNRGTVVDESVISGGVGALPSLTAAGGANAMAPMESIDEIAVRTFPTVKEGRTSGASVDITTKAGTNYYHGSLFETFGNEALNAADPFAKSRGFGRAPERLNLFGGSLGGFFVRDKLFFFGSYEGMRFRKGSFSISETPSAAARLAAAPDLRTVFNLFPLSNGPATADGFAEFSSLFANPASHNIFSYRMDANLSDELAINGTYNFSGSRAAWRGDRDLSLNTIRSLDIRSTSVSARATYMASPSVAIDGYAAFGRSVLGNRYTIDNFGGAALPTSLFSNGSLKYDLGERAGLISGDETRSTVNEFQAGGTLSWVSGKHSAAFGGGFRRLAFDIVPLPLERSVLFNGLDPSGIAARINEISRTAPGSRSIGNFSLFGQDEIRINARFNLTAGIRWDMDFAPDRATPATALQNAVSRIGDSVNNFAPRIGVAIDPQGNGRSAVRFGAGLFYNFGNLQAGDSFANSYPFATGAYSRGIPFNAAPATRLDPLALFADDLKTPRAWQIFAGYEREIFDHYKISASYAAVFGRSLLLPRTILNADPVYKIIRFTDNSGSSNFQALNLGFEHRLAHNFSFHLRYSLSKSTDNVSHDSVRIGNFASDPAQEKGASDFDARHIFSAYGTFSIPTPFKSGLAKWLTSDWSVYSFVNARSATPVNVTYARVTDLGVQIARPNTVPGVSPFTAANGIKAIDPAAFSIPAGPGQGASGRNSLRGFGVFQANVGAERTFKFGGESQLRISAEAHNLLNNVNYENMNGSLGTVFQDGTYLPNYYFGKAASTLGSGGFTPFYIYGAARTLQLSAKFIF